MQGLFHPRRHIAIRAKELRSFCLLLVTPTFVRGGGFPSVTPASRLASAMSPGLANHLAIGMTRGCIGDWRPNRRREAGDDLRNRGGGRARHRLRRQHDDRGRPAAGQRRGRNESEQRGGEGECQATDGLSCSDVGWSRAKVRMNPAFVNIVMGVRWGMI
jgi:hypothetical protein